MKDAACRCRLGLPLDASLSGSGLRTKQEGGSSGGQVLKGHTDILPEHNSMNKLVSAQPWPGILIKPYGNNFLTHQQPVFFIQTNSKHIKLSALQFGIKIKSFYYKKKKKKTLKRKMKRLEPRAVLTLRVQTTLRSIPHKAEKKVFFNGLHRSSRYSSVCMFTIKAGRMNQCLSKGQVIRKMQFTSV